MNLSRLRKMVREGDISSQSLRYLLDCHGECEHLDYKEELHYSSDHGKADIAKDIVAMRNTGGGYIIIGVKDKTWEPVGLTKNLNLDTKLLRDLVRGVTGLEIDCDVVSHRVFVNDQYRIFSAILVRSTAKLHKLRTPSVCKNNFAHRESWGVRQGDIYFRKIDQTVRLSSQEELDILVGELIDQQDLDTLANELAEPSPFWVENGFYRLLPREYEIFVGRKLLRDEAISAIEKDPRIWIVNLFGPGGVGKSALANWLAYHYYENGRFDAILQLSAKDSKLEAKGISVLRPTLYSLENLVDRVLQLFTFDNFLNDDIERKKELAIELLANYNTLLILDNLETIKDGRIMDFVRSMPFGSKVKVLLTSRQRTAGWELAIPVNELNEEEVREFTEIKASEMSIALPSDVSELSKDILAASGGLPLAIQWVLGQYAATNDWNRVFSKVRDQSSPLLEFSFRNSWNILPDDARIALAVLSVFEEPPTMHLWATALEWAAEAVERAVQKLIEMTFVSRIVDKKTGYEIFRALPITLDFARNELRKMGTLEVTARSRYQRHIQEMELVAAETERFGTLFERFDVERDTEKRAIILASKAEAQVASLNHEEAERLYQMALDLDPRSTYVLMNYGLFKRSIRQIGEAIQYLEQATQRVTSKTGFIIYYNLSQTYDEMRDRPRVESCLRKALQYNPDHTVARHQLGVVISRLGRYSEAIAVFDEIIQFELARKQGPSETLLYSYKTKVINLRKAGRNEEAKKELKVGIETVKRFAFLARRVYELEDLS